MAERNPEPKEEPHARTHTRRRRAVLDRPLQLRHRQGEEVLRPAVRLDDRGARRPSSAATSPSRRTASIVAGCMANDGEQGVPDAWTVYLTTDDADRTAEAAAGERRPGPHRADGRGRRTAASPMIGDPGGAAIGVWQPREAEGLRGPERGRRRRLVRAAHARLRPERRLLPRRLRVGRAHGERRARAPLHDARRGRGDARRDHGRVRSSSPRAAPAAWSVYFQVEDVDAALERGRRARRHGRAGGRGHAVRPDGRGHRPDRHAGSSW